MVIYTDTNHNANTCELQVISGKETNVYFMYTTPNLI